MSVNFIFDPDLTVYDFADSARPAACTRIKKGAANRTIQEGMMCVSDLCWTLSQSLDNHSGMWGTAGPYGDSSPQLESLTHQLFEVELCTTEVGTETCFVGVSAP